MSALVETIDAEIAARREQIKVLEEDVLVLSQMAAQAEKLNGAGTWSESVTVKVPVTWEKPPPAENGRTAPGASADMVLQAVEKLGECSKPQIVAETGLTIAAAGNAIKRLVKDGKLDGIGQTTKRRYRLPRNTPPPANAPAAAKPAANVSVEDRSLVLDLIRQRHGLSAGAIVLELQDDLDGRVVTDALVALEDQGRIRHTSAGGYVEVAS